MPDVTFFHHERVDDARRTGLTVDGSRALERYVPGDEEYDPVLKWVVDVKVPVAEEVETRVAAADWLAAHGDTIQAALAAAADRLYSGVDSDWSPWEVDVDTPDGAVRVSVYARLHTDGHQMGRHLRTVLQRDWPAFREQFRPAMAGV